MGLPAVSTDSSARTTQLAREAGDELAIRPECDPRDRLSPQDCTGFEVLHSLAWQAQQNRASVGSNPWETTFILASNLMERRILSTCSWQLHRWLVPQLRCCSRDCNYCQRTPHVQQFQCSQLAPDSAQSDSGLSSSPWCRANNREWNTIPSRQNCSKPVGDLIGHPGKWCPKSAKGACL